MNLRKSVKSNKVKRIKYSVKLELEKIDWDKTEKIFTNDKRDYLETLEKDKKRNPQTKEILTILAGGAIIGLSFVFPALPVALVPFFIDSNKYNRRGINHVIKRLNQQKLVEIVEEGNQAFVRITQKGRVRALRYKLSEIQVKKPKVWDKKWRIVIFDIPEKYKRMREIFRDHLKMMGFYMLQKSVWVHPYPCGSEIEFLRQIYNVGINVTYILAEKIENSENLKDYFKL